MDPFSSPVLILSAAQPRPLHHRSSGLDACWEVNFFVGAGVDVRAASRPASLLQYTEHNLP